MATYYETLGLEKGASQKEISRTFRKLSKGCHPDLFPGDKAKEEQFKLLEEAYRVLSDPEERAYYDQTGETRKPQVDAERLEILRMLTDVMGAAIMEMENPATQDLIKLMKSKIKEGRKIIAEKSVEASEFRIKLELVRKRIFTKADGQDNLLVSIVKGKIDNIDEQIARGKLMIETFDKGVKLLDGYGYEVTELLMSPDLADVYADLVTGRRAYFRFKT